MGLVQRVVMHARPTEWYGLAPALSSSRLLLAHEEEEQHFRQHNIGAASVGLALLLVVLSPTTLYPSYDAVGFPIILLAILGAGVAYVYNKRGAVTHGAVVLVASASLAIAGKIVGAAYVQGGLSISDLRLFSFFALPIMLSVLVLPRRAIVIVAACTFFFTLLAALAMPHTTRLAAYIQHQAPYSYGSIYDVLAYPLILQLSVALLGYLGSSGMSAAIQRASRADALAEAQRQIAAQSEELQRHTRRLELGIQRIQEVYTAVTRGNWNVRVQAPDNTLLPLTVSFNRLLDRTVSLMAVAEDYRRLRAALTSTEMAIVARKRNLKPPFPRHTGTALDELLELIHDLSETHELRPKPVERLAGIDAPRVIPETRPMAARDRLGEDAI